jgi:PadR family transcriptional regulator PadR
MRKSLIRAQTTLARALLAGGEGPHFGADLWERTGIRTGVLYPLLTQMMTDGWLADGWESPVPVGRPPRRYFRVTPYGFVALTRLVDASRT